jgi:hypothetical protein
MLKKINIFLGLGLVMGAAGGYLYWYYVGCASGSCAITSSPVNSSLYGGLMGFLLVNSFRPVSSGKGQKD